MKRKRKQVEMVPGYASKAEVDALFEKTDHERARRRFTKIEDETMRRHDDSPVAVPPGAGWRLVAKRRFQTATQIFDVGCAVEVAQLGKNFAALLGSHFVGWVPPSTLITVKAKPLPAPPAPAKGNPPVEIVHDADVVASWRKTVSLMTDRCGGNAARARDLLLANPVASEIYLRATRVWCVAEAKRQGVVSVSPSPGF